MKVIGIAGLLLILAAPLGVANADPWKDGSDRGRDRGYSRSYDRDDDDRGRRERKVEYYDGRCKVEQKWGKNGEYKEERKCWGESRGFEGYGSSHAPQGWIDPPAYRGYR